MGSIEHAICEVCSYIYFSIGLYGPRGLAPVHNVIPQLKGMYLYAAFATSWMQLRTSTDSHWSLLSQTALTL